MLKFIHVCADANVRMAQTCGEFLARGGARAGLDAVARYPRAARCDSWARMRRLRTVRAQHRTSFFFRRVSTPIGSFM